MIGTLYRAAQICVHGAEYYIVNLYVWLRERDEISVLFQHVILYRVGQWLNVHGARRTAFNEIGAIALVSKYAKMVTFNVEGTDRRMMAHLLGDVLEVFHYQLVSLAQHGIKCFLGPSFDIVVHSYAMNGAKCESFGRVGRDVGGFL